MLTRTFLHIQGIGETTERKIWRSGIQGWHDFVTAHDRGDLRGRRIESAIRDVVESIRQYDSGRWDYFDKSLPSHHKWRGFGDLGDQALYLDIETTGMGGEDEITVIGTYDGKEAKSFVAGDNLNEAIGEIENHPLIVTYNGAQFDLPVIRRQFRCNLFNHIHIDLRFPLRRLGYVGGLKRIEEAFGIERSARTKGLDGWDAVRLWREYEHGHDAALDLLLEYNREDIKNLEPLMHFVFREMSKSLEL
ncbi:MAG: ribonuclease H-like domain-containing protein [Verrucomicrobiota bacterium]